MFEKEKKAREVAKYMYKIYKNLVPGMDVNDLTLYYCRMSDEALTLIYNDIKHL